jgi:hypothetical protein
VPEARRVVPALRASRASNHDLEQNLRNNRNADRNTGKEDIQQLSGIFREMDGNLILHRPPKKHRRTAPEFVGRGFSFDFSAGTCIGAHPGTAEDTCSAGIFTGIFQRAGGEHT